MAQLTGQDIFGPSVREKADTKAAEAAALRILGNFGVIEPPVNPVRLAQGIGVRVEFVSFEGDAQQISGFYDYSTNTISVNRAESPLRQTFTLAHELGHSLLHKDWVASADYRVYRRNQVRDAKEIEADTFAANLLMPRFLMDQYYDALPVEGLSQLFAVSVPAMKARLSYLYGF